MRRVKTPARPVDVPDDWDYCTLGKHWVPIGTLVLDSSRLRGYRNQCLECRKHVTGRPSAVRYIDGEAVVVSADSYLPKVSLSVLSKDKNLLREHLRWRFTEMLDELLMYGPKTVKFKKHCRHLGDEIRQLAVMRGGQEAQMLGMTEYSDLLGYLLKEYRDD